MNLIELLTFIGIIALIGFVSFLLGKFLGTVGWIIGIVLGVAVCALIYYGFSKFITSLHKRYPLRPTCRQGKCFADDYELIEVNEAGGSFSCRCGDKYIRKGNRFMIVDKNGIPQPFMKRQGKFHPWEEDR